MDTIYATATARGKAGIAVVRLSGPLAHSAVGALVGGALPSLQRASLRRFVWDGVLIDEGLVLLFAPMHSFTGEAVAELHLHGSVAVVSAMLRALSQQAGLRLAEPGEFTRRALENGRLDLTQVEGLADLIDSETEMQRLQALKVLSGAVGKKAEGWRKQLIRAAALLEATIDFVDEDVPIDVAPEVLALISGLLAELRAEAEGALIAERVRDGFVIAIVGRPNVGKSTLLNALAGRDAAITSEVAGTTRDVIEVRMDLGGLPVTMLDTAGLHETSDTLELMGIERAIARANEADLRIFLIDSKGMPENLTLKEGDIVAYAKGDLSAEPNAELAVSGKTGAGLPQLLRDIEGRLQHRVAASQTLTRERHRTMAISAISSLEEAQDEVRLGPHRTEIAAEQLRQAIRSLDALVGRVNVENLLDEIFSSFCIGK